LNLGVHSEASPIFLVALRTYRTTIRASSALLRVLSFQDLL
jgi:hypothetical protein